MMSNPNLGHQFTAYRGLVVATGKVPDNDEEILQHLRSKSDALPPSGLLPNGLPEKHYEHAFGRHWTTDRDVAERFATTPGAGGYETQPAWSRKFTGHEHYGVVIEGQVHLPDRPLRTNNTFTWQGENEVIGGVKKDELLSATAHVVKRATPMDRRDARRAGLPEPHGVQTVRSIEIPTEKWR